MPVGDQRRRAVSPASLRAVLGKRGGFQNRPNLYLRHSGAGLAYFAADHMAGFVPPGPVLLLVGDLDEVAPPSNSRAIAAAWPNTTLTEIKGAGHLLQIEKSDQFNRAVVEFLKD